VLSVSVSAPSAFDLLKSNTVINLAGLKISSVSTSGNTVTLNFAAPRYTNLQWYEYNSQDYTGWPTQDNPYETGQPSGNNNGLSSGTDEVVILHLTPR